MSPWVSPGVPPQKGAVGGHQGPPGEKGEEMGERICQWRCLGCRWIVEGIRALEGGCVGIQHRRPQLFKHSCDAISKRQKWTHLPSTFGQGRTSAADSARSKQPEPIQPRTHTRSQDEKPRPFRPRPHSPPLTELSAPYVTLQRDRQCDIPNRTCTVHKTSSGCD